jgi:uncharacterized transporter YbjL
MLTKVKAGKAMKQARRAQILAMCLGLWLGLGLIAIYFVGWLVGIAVVSLGLGSTLIVIDAASDRREHIDGP